MVGEAGVCGGKRVCTDEGLSDCDAPTPAPEICNGLDDDNPCTADTCLAAAGCTHINNCYCWGSCSGYTWYSNCCSGWQTQVMVTEVTCQQ